jgi:hypothetical protein
MKKITTFFLILNLTACISTKSTIKNIDNTVSSPKLNEKLDCFVLTEKSTDEKYGYNKDYPINVGFTNIENGTQNEQRFLNALASPTGKTIKYKLTSTCCPFPTSKTETGAGTLDIYEITWDEQEKPIELYLNKYEKGALLIPSKLNVRK